MTLLLMLSLASGAVQAAPALLPPRPQAQAPAGDQCTQALALRAGQAPPQGLLDAEGLVACSAAVVPTVDTAHLLALEAWGDEVAALYELEVPTLLLQVSSLEQQVLALQVPPPWWEQPRVQRWVGRAEVAAVVLLGAGVGVAVHRAVE